MKLKDVENLAELAKLEISEEEKQSLIKDFDSILAYVDMIKEVDVGDTQTENSIYNICREDIERAENSGVPEFSAELLVSQFPDQKEGYAKVKKIL